MWRERNRGVLSSIAIALAVGLLFQASAFGNWEDKSGDLPGIESTGHLLKTVGIVGGAAVGALLVVHLIRNNKEDKVPSKVPSQKRAQETSRMRSDQHLLFRAGDRAAAKVLAAPIRLPELPLCQGDRLDVKGTSPIVTPPETGVGTGRH